MICHRFLVVAALVLSACDQRTSRPNVLLITIDTLRADRLGCYGYARARSPHIDRLAAQGALFERAYTTLPRTDRKSTRLNSSHLVISYAVFCLKKKKSTD